MYIAKILITLRKTILDPQGKAVEHSLKSLGYDSIKDTRIGKYVELKIDAKDELSAKTIADEACKKLLANSVMEDYSFDVIKSEE
jgi:phosphoribosylformylglycinamidine synthase PurS subunit